MTITDAYQLEIRGVLVGEGADFIFDGPIEGLGIPDVRTTDTLRPQSDGVFTGNEYLAAREVVIPVGFYADTQAELETKEFSLKGAFAPLSEDVVLTFRLSDTTYQLTGRPRGGTLDLERRPAGYNRLLCRFVATDPRITDYNEQTLELALSSASGGLEFDATAPFEFGTSGNENIGNAENEGNYPADWVVTLTGPLTNPTIANNTTGDELNLVGSLAADETMELSSRDHTILLNGTASRYSWLRNSDSWWWRLEPGANEFNFSASAGSGTCEVAWRSTWI